MRLLKILFILVILLNSQLFANFYALINNKTVGPLNDKQISEMIKNGEITKNTYIWKNGMKAWKKAGEQEEFKKFFLSKTSPPPPPLQIDKVKENQNIDNIQNEVSSADIDKDFNSSNLDKWKEDFEKKFQPIGITKNGRTFFYGEAIVRVSQLDPAYAKEVTIAYDKAILNMQADFIMQTYGRMVTERILDYFENDSTNADEFPPVKLKKAAREGKIGVIFDKFLDVVENKLDSMLEKQGVPEDKIKKMTVEQKKIIYKDNFKKSMIKKAVQNLSGLVPVQTKIITEHTPNGDAVKIGVIGVISQKTIQFARDIAKRRPTLVRGKPKKLSDILPKNKNEYMNEYGLRFIYDEQGRPMLLSYGVWSVVGKTINPRRYLRKIQIAKEKARMLAESYIGEFIKSSIEVKQSADIESSTEEIAKKVTEIEQGNAANFTESKSEIGETLDTYFKKITAKSNFHLRGTTQIKTWEAKDKNGILYVGSVVVWSYNQLENANNFDRMKYQKYKPKRKHSKKLKIKKENRKSKLVNDVNDF